MLCALFMCFPQSCRHMFYHKYMLFASREVRIGKNCARGLVYVPRPQRAQFFPNYTDRPRPANNVFIFFSQENYFIRNICVGFLLKQFRTVGVRLTFRTSNTEKEQRKANQHDTHSWKLEVALFITYKSHQMSKMSLKCHTYHLTESCLQFIQNL